MLDLVGEATLAPEILALDARPVFGEVRLELADLGVDVVLRKIRTMNRHQFIIADSTSCGHPIGRPHPVDGAGVARIRTARDVGAVARSVSGFSRFPHSGRH